MAMSSETEIWTLNLGMVDYLRILPFALSPDIFETPVRGSDSLYLHMETESLSGLDECP